ncbi:hypothetical protein VCUG_00721 [Vavraia culicis subsp. floridensis]|uniref:Uncharacterized protein n=1 Tax=Vavraia culicis (isolate floridensis) TaxID=948595 RepID=L2GXC9_VAVCU|nr:uncharacterized protein VCUG_00721 [Vavraia culicis subsp. floridensis]ELA47760.1 hypothetical protein VCUG_00721 [Vavraia culicis subsp. floridensis]
MKRKLKKKQITERGDCVLTGYFMFCVIIDKHTYISLNEVVAEMVLCLRTYHSMRLLQKWCCAYVRITAWGCCRNGAVPTYVSQHEVVAEMVLCLRTYHSMRLLQKWCCTCHLSKNV